MEEAEGFAIESDEQFCDAIELLLQRCDALGKTLVIRDWSHADFHGFPYFSDCTYQLRLREVLLQRFDVRSVATVRHPLNHYLSMKQLTVLKKRWDDCQVLTGMHHFAEEIQSMPWFRHEDFACDSDGILQQITVELGIPFAPSYRDLWWKGSKITGDGTRQNGQIRAPIRRSVPTELWPVLSNSTQFRQTLDLLGYRMPLPLKSLGWRDAEADDSESRNLTERGNECLNAGDFRTAIALYERQLRRDPIDDATANNLGFCLMQIGEHEEAASHFEAILKRSPDSPHPLRNLAACLESLDRRFEAIPFLRRLISISPEEHWQRFQLAKHLHGIGALDESLSHLRLLFRAGYRADAVASDYLMFLNYSDCQSAEQIAKEHFRVGMQFARQPQAAKPRVLQARDRLRIGYLCKDFYTHPVGKLITPILEAHDRQQVEIFAYHDGEKRDALTKRTEAAVETFRATWGTNDRDLEARLRADQLDVLVDLAGFSGGGNRLRLFASRCAPLQVAFLGYPATAAVPAIDFRITDHYADPPGQADGYYSERPLYLACGFLAYQAPDWIRQIHEEPRSRERLRIGCFNNVAKISRSAMACWAEILKRTPEIDLTLKYGDRYQVTLVADRFREIFAANGVCPSRLDFRPMTTTYHDHFRQLAEVDLALDSFPYQGTMTTLETLSVGTPIVSLAGKYYAHRATSAMIIWLGMEELVASDEDEYVEIACQLLRSPDLLRGLRGELLERFFNSPLTDVPGFTQALETELLAQYQAFAPGSIRNG
ncbi:tetratricopeptide repeat protein [Rosistilla oblonga]|uniref:O-linked N-acetylglucosamine transferase, SPINDLY family protein n=1 Tax=Rosistilla oblonga TaxID=2527990 RepID=UPI0018D26D79|nr:tetratricopeptide repeat protein [Rosistilla oblonga]